MALPPGAPPCLPEAATTASEAASTVTGTPAEVGANGRWPLAIRVIETYHEDLGCVEFARGEPMALTLTREAGLFFLDIEAGRVEQIQRTHEGASGQRA